MYFNFWNNFRQTDSINRTDDSTFNDIDDTGHSAVNVAVNDSASVSSNNVDSDLDLEEPYLRHITSAVYNYCGTEILASYSEDDIYLFDAHGRSNTVLHNYGGHLNRMTGI